MSKPIAADSLSPIRALLEGNRSNIRSVVRQLDLPSGGASTRATVEELEFTRAVIELLGAGSFVSVARYSLDGHAHIEVFGPMPRGWREMVPARVRRCEVSRFRWRNSRGGRSHFVGIGGIIELAAELAAQKAERGGA